MTVWRHEDDGTPLKFQDGDFVRVTNPSAPYELPFYRGYVRGYDISTVTEDDGPFLKETVSVGYELYRMGHNPLCWVPEERLELDEVPDFDDGTHGKNHTEGAVCHLCGYGL